MGMFSKFWQGVVATSMIAAPLAMAKVTIYMLGDSTMQDWADGYYPKQGQGQDFHYWFDVNKAAVVNRGQGGMSLGGGGKDKKGNTIEHFDYHFGVKRVECVGEVFKINGKNVKLRGVNRVACTMILQRRSITAIVATRLLTRALQRN